MPVPGARGAPIPSPGPNREDVWARRHARDKRTKASRNQGPWEGAGLAVQKTPADGIPHIQIPDDPPEAREKYLHKIAQRQKQLTLGKQTIGYKNYCIRVPKEARDPNDPSHPTTPDASWDISKRRFDEQTRYWRRQLHAWDRVGPHVPDADNGMGYAVSEGHGGFDGDVFPPDAVDVPFPAVSTPPLQVIDPPAGAAFGREVLGRPLPQRSGMVQTAQDGRDATRWDASMMPASMPAPHGSAVSEAAVGTPVRGSWNKEPPASSPSGPAVMQASSSVFEDPLIPTLTRPRPAFSALDFPVPRNRSPARSSSPQSPPLANASPCNDPYAHLKHFLKASSTPVDETQAVSPPLHRVAETSASPTGPMPPLEPFPSPLTQAPPRTAWPSAHTPLREHHTSPMTLTSPVALACGDPLIPDDALHTDDGEHCVVCGVGQRSVLLLPCRHLCMCRACAERQGENAVCPRCHGVIHGRLEVNLS